MRWAGKLRLPGSVGFLPRGTQKVSRKFIDGSLQKLPEAAFVASRLSVTVESLGAQAALAHVAGTFNMRS
jgi:hypothetical protein